MISRAIAFRRAIKFRRVLIQIALVVIAAFAIMLTIPLPVGDMASVDAVALPELAGSAIGVGS